MNINKYQLISILIINCLLTTSYSLAQNKVKIDSLLNQLSADPSRNGTGREGGSAYGGKTTKADTNKINILISLAKCYGESNVDSAIIFSKQLLELSEKLANSSNEAFAKSGIKGIYKAYHILGNAHCDKGNYEKALKYLSKSLKLCKKWGDSEEIASNLNTIAVVWHLKGNYENALSFYLKSLSYCEDNKIMNFIWEPLSNIGRIYLDMGNLKKAEEYFKRSLKIAEKSCKKKEIANSLNNLGDLYQMKEKFEKALVYFSKALEIFKEIDYKKGIAHGYNNIAIIYYFQKNNDKCIEYFIKALEIREIMGNKIDISQSLNNIGLFYQYQGKYAQAIDYNLRALKVAKEINAKIEIADAYGALNEVYEAKKDYKKAYDYYVLYNQIRDSLFSEESNKQIADMQTKYETEKKEKEIALLNKEKQLQKTELAQKQAEIKKKNIQRNAFIGGFVLVLALVFVVYRGYSEKKRSNKVLSEKNILITRQKAELTQTLEELRATQEQLVESEKMASLGNLVAGVAHEINTPVGIGITASSSLVEDTKQFAELYKKDKMSRKALEKFLENTFEVSNLILKNMNRTGELVQSFKQVSVDQMVDEARKFNLKSYLNDIILSIKPEFGKKTIKVDIDCDKNLELNSFPGAFAQIITNLTLNSIKHGFRERDEGDIKITIRQTAPSGQTAKQLILQYSDDGCGISKENLPKIFDPFFTTNKQIGTGLGLHIVYNLVTQKLKGTVNCESKEGQGVLFKIDIPLNNG